MIPIPSAGALELATDILKTNIDGDPMPTAIVQKYRQRLAVAIQEAIDCELESISDDMEMPSRERDADDGSTYGDPRDEMAERLDRD